MREKEKSFQNNAGKRKKVFYPVKDKNHDFSNHEFVVCKSLQFGLGQDFVLWERVKFHWETDESIKIKVKCVTLKLLSASQGPFVESVDQDQSARKGQPDLGSTLLDTEVFFRKIYL